MKITQKSWEHPSVQLYTISDPRSHFTVKITNFGASLVEILMPNLQQHVENVIYGFTSLHDYQTQKGYLGATIGRVANRIGHAHFQLEGRDYHLFANNSPHCLHGGQVGFSHRIWNLRKSSHLRPDGIQLHFEYISADGEEGFPGQLTVQTIYTIFPFHIEWEFKATTTHSTIVNLTNHAYYNLEGFDSQKSPMSSTIDSHILTVSSDAYNVTDQSCLPTGEIRSVSGLGVDFRKGRRLADTFAQFGDVDHNFILNDYPGKASPTALTHAATLFSPKSGREMIIQTTEPCIQIYTGNFMPKIQIQNRDCQKHAAICLETQRTPNAINMPSYANSVILLPNQQYHHRTTHDFKIHT